MKHGFILIFTLLLFFSCLTADPAWKPSGNDAKDLKYLTPFVSVPPLWYGKIEKTADGDTFYVDYYTHLHMGVRVKGIDTPETEDDRKYIQFGGEAASLYAETLLVPGTLVCLEFDSDIVDTFGRLLAKVWIWDDINKKWFDWGDRLLRQGIAVVYFKYPVDGIEKLLEAQAEAILAKRGLWADEALIEQDIAKDLPQVFAKAAWYRKELKEKDPDLYMKLSAQTGKK